VTFPSSSEYGRCPCSGTYERREIEVGMSVRAQRITLTQVGAGVCPLCGSRVYKAGVLYVVEALMRDRPVGPDGKSSED